MVKFWPFPVECRDCAVCEMCLTCRPVDDTLCCDCLFSASAHFLARLPNVQNVQNFTVVRKGVNVMTYASETHIPANIFNSLSDGCK